MSAMSTKGLGAVMTVAVLVPLYLGAHRTPFPGTTGDGLRSASDPGAASGEPDVTVRRVWEGVEPDFWASKPSPDGRYLTEIDWSTGDLAVIDLLTGEQRRVTDKGSWAERSEWAETSVFSPDGSRIAYVYYSQDMWRYQIRTIGLDGSDARVVLDPASESFYALLQGWQGDRILAWLWPCEQVVCPEQGGAEAENVVQLAWVSVEDGGVQTIRRFPDASRLEIAWLPAVASPDGRYVVYGFHRNPGEPGENTDLVMLSATGEELFRVDGPSNDLPLGWTRDGRTFLFQSDRGLTEGVWAQEFRDGRLLGSPRLLRGDLWRMNALGLSANELFYGVFTQSPAVYVASVDPETGALLPDPVALEEPSAAISGSPIWSPDGRRIAYAREVGNVMFPERTLVVASLAGGDAREIDLPRGLEGPSFMRWTDDGHIYGIAKHPDTGLRGLFRVVLASGSVEHLVSLDDELLAGMAQKRRFGLSPDGRTGYFVTAADEAGSPTTRVVAVEFETGEVRDVTDPVELRPWGGATVSPDGSSVAVVAGDPAVGSTLYLVPANGGEPRPLFSVQFPMGLGAAPSLTWSHDGTAVFVPVWDESEGGRLSARWRVNLSTGEATPIEDSAVAIHLEARGVALHPGGTRAAFVGGVPRGEVWMLRGLDGGSE